MASFTRESKFRHCVVTVAKREQQYENLKTLQPPSDINGVAGNSKFFAYIDSNGSGSCLGVLPLTSFGKNHIPVSSPAYQQPILRAHSQAIQDFDFNPFNHNQIFTCSTDKAVKVWDIPSDGLTIDKSDATLSFTTKSHTPWKGLAVHKSVEGLLAVRGNREVALFDTSNGSELFATNASVFTQDILSLSWSFLGDLLVTTAKDKLLKLIDIRANAAVAASTTAHAGIRFSRSTWLGNSPYLLTSGHNAMQEREFMIWDSRNLSTAVKRERVDNATGSLIPIFDVDHSVLLLAGKGDASIRMYEFTDLTGGDEQTKPAAHALSNNPAGDVTRGITLLPKQANDLLACEVFRVLKLTDNVIVPVSITVPRKEKLKFQEDLFPPTYSEAPVAGTKEQWLSGANATPNTVNIAAPGGGSSSGLSSANGSLKLSVNFDELSIEKGESGASSPVPSDGFDSKRSSSRVVSGLTSLIKYRHMYGTEYSKDSTFYNLSPDLAPDNPIIACSDTYWAIPYRGGGGPVYVSKLSQYGKVMPDCAVLNGHKSAVQDIAFSPFHSGLMATGSADCTVKIWDLDTHEQNCADNKLNFSSTLGELQPLCNLTSHTNSLRTVNFHPTVPNLLVTTSQDMTLRTFDVQSGSEVSCLNVYNSFAEQSQIVNVSFNYNGTLIAVASKDRVVRIVDARSNKVVQWTETGLGTSSSTPENTNRTIGRNLRTEWCNMNGGTCDPISTVSAGSSGLRQIHLWDPRNLESPVQTKIVDNASGQLFPFFDEGLSTLFVAGKGDTIVRSYEIMSMRDVTASSGNAASGANSPVRGGTLSNISAASVDTSESAASATESIGPLFFEKSSDFQSSREPIAGICILPKRVLDVRNIEVTRILKLTSDTVIPCTFKVPRADHLKAYFHDDIYPPVRAKHSEVTVSDWKCKDIPASLFDPVLESLRPADMSNISEKPAEAAPSTLKSKVESFKQDIARKESENKIKEDNFAKLQKLAEQNAQYNVNRSGPMKIGGVIVTNLALEAADEVDSDDNWEDDN